MKRKDWKEEKDPFLYKTPPVSLEAEESLLSAILIDNDVLDDIVEIISPEDFYRTAHKKIFSTVIELYGNDEPIDIITLSNRLREKGDLEKTGGATYLARLIDTVPLAVNPAHYAKIIFEKASLRRLIKKASKIINFCFEDKGDFRAVFDFAESSIFSLTEKKIRSSCSPIENILKVNFDSLEERQKNKGAMSGIPTGYAGIDTLTAGLQASDLIILAARPSMGKTAFALNIARNVAVEANVAVVIFSLEMSKEQLSMRMLCSEARTNSSKLRDGFLSKEDWDKLSDAANILSQSPIYLDDSPNIKPLDIRAKTRRLKMKHDIGLVIIDYLQLMEAQNKSDRRDLEISEISRSLKGLAKELNVPIIALSQLNRNLELRHDKRPQLSDLRESGSIEQDADLVFFIYRDEVHNREPNNPNAGKAEIILSKHRNGPTGKADLAFLQAYTRFENLAF